MTAALVPLVFVALNVVYGATAWPAGALSDRLGTVGLMRLSILSLAMAHLALALATGVAPLFAGVALWGLHMGLSQGLLAAAVARAAPEGLRGTAFGVFNLVGGIATVLANALAGALWAGFGAPATFAVAGAGALLALVLVRR